MKQLIVALGVVLVFACSGSKGPLYKVEVKPVEVALNTVAHADVRIVPQGRYHWNDEFPARAQVTDAGGLELDKMEFSGSDFKVEDGTGRLAFPVIAKTAGRFTIKLKTDFAICDDKGCIPFKNVQIEVPINAR